MVLPDPGRALAAVVCFTASLDSISISRRVFAGLTGAGGNTAGTSGTAGGASDAVVILGLTTFLVFRRDFML